MPRKQRSPREQEVVTTGVRLGRQGRIVIPRELRARLGLKQGDGLDVSVEGGALVLRPRAEILAELQAMFRGVRGSLSKELSAERRKAAAELEE